MRYLRQVVRDHLILKQHSTMKIISVLISLALAGALPLSAQTRPAKSRVYPSRPVGQDTGTLISGFVINSSVPKTVMIRGVGPTWHVCVGDAVAQANITVFDGNGNVVAPTTAI